MRYANADLTNNHPLIKRGRGQIWIRVFPDILFTMKSVEVSMGKGKDSILYLA